MSAPEAAPSLRRANEEIRDRLLAVSRGECLGRIIARLQDLRARMPGLDDEGFRSALSELEGQIAALRERRTFADRVSELVATYLGTDRYETYLGYHVKAAEQRRPLVDLVRRYRRVEDARCLDVGSGSGGCLVAFGESGAREVVGFEIDPRRVELARLNLAEHGIRGLAVVADAMDAQAVAVHGAFEIITCTDVIEHVPDARRLAENLARLCAPGGIVVVTAPNPHACTNVLADPHHGFFGSILLSRADAERRFKECFPGAGAYAYDLGEMRDLDWYLTAFGEVGLAACLASDEARQWKPVLAELQTAADEIERRQKAQASEACLSDETRAALGRVVSEYLARLREDLRRLRAARRDRALLMEIVRRYGIAVYVIVARSAQAVGLDAEGAR